MFVKTFKEMFPYAIKGILYFWLGLAVLILVAELQSRSIGGRLTKLIFNETSALRVKHLASFNARESHNDYIVYSMSSSSSIEIKQRLYDESFHGDFEQWKSSIPKDMRGPCVERAKFTPSELLYLARGYSNIINTREYRLSSIKHIGSIYILRDSQHRNYCVLFSER